MRIASPRPQVRLLLILRSILLQHRVYGSSSTVRALRRTSVIPGTRYAWYSGVNGTSASSGSYRPLSSSMLPLRLLESGKGDDQGRQNGATEAAPTEYGSLPFTYCKYSSSSSIILLHHTMHLTAAASVYQVTCTWTGRFIVQSEK